MATKTIRTKDGRYITVDTKTGNEIKPFEGNLKFLKDAADAVGLTTLPANLPGMVERLAQDIYNLPGDIGPNLVYSDETDNKGRPLTLAQKANRDKGLANFMRGGQGGEFDTNYQKGLNKFMEGGEGGKYDKTRMAGDEIKKIITVTGADGVPVQLNMNNPADVARLRSIEQKVNPITIPAGDADDDGNNPPTNNPPVAPPSPTRSNMAEKTELERMTAFVKANKKLAEKVKPGQAGYEEIQIALGRMPSMPDEVQTFKSTDEGVTDPTESAKALGIEKLYDAQTNPQAFLSSRLAGDVKSDFSEALTSKTIMPEGEQLGVATDVPEDLFTRDITPQLQSAFLKKPLVKGMSLNTGARN